MPARRVPKVPQVVRIIEQVGEETWLSAIIHQLERAERETELSKLQGLLNIRRYHLARHLATRLRRLTQHREDFLGELSQRVAHQRRDGAQNRPFRLFFTRRPGSDFDIPKLFRALIYG